MKLAFEQSVFWEDAALRFRSPLYPRRKYLTTALLRKTPPAPAGVERDRRKPPLFRTRDAGLRRQRRILSAGFLHDEIQPRGQRTGGLAGRLPRDSPAPARRTPRRARSSCSSARKSCFAQLVGMEEMTFQPAAGAHGEFLGLSAHQALSREERRLREKKDYRAGLRARHQPRNREHGGLHGGQHPLRAGRNGRS